MAEIPRLIETQELIKHIDDPHSVIIDIRPTAAYNGWQLKEESRGGHIRGATNIPLKWTKYIDFKDVLQTKAITPDKTLIIYGYKQSDSEWLAQKLMDSGYSWVAVYPNFMNEWVPNTDLPMQRLERYSQLVYPEWLKSLIDGEQPPYCEGSKYVICHSHYGYEHDYHEGHIPGAIPLNTNDLESEYTWNRRSPKELEKTLLSHGIDKDTTVVVYGRFSFPDNNDPYPGQSAGHLGAIRCAAIMLYATVERRG